MFIISGLWDSIWLILYESLTNYRRNRSKLLMGKPSRINQLYSIFPMLSPLADAASRHHLLFLCVDQDLFSETVFLEDYKRGHTAGDVQLRIRMEWQDRFPYLGTCPRGVVLTISRLC